MGEDASQANDEPVPGAHAATGAGSTSSPAAAASGDLHAQPPLRNDVLRAMLCALIVVLSVGSPSTAVLFAPFAPLLVAIRIVRHRGGVRRFLQLATGASLVAAAVTVRDLVDLSTTAGLALLSAGLLGALLLVPILGIVHARAVRNDPIDPAPTDLPEWPEPRLDSGFSLAIIGWLVAVALLAASVLPVTGSVAKQERAAVKSGYSFYVDACKPGGAFASRTDFCESILDQRETTLQMVDDYAGELLAALLAIFVFGAAGTAHMLALARTRHAAQSRIRPAWKLRELEAHWASMYLVVIGLMAIMLVTGESLVAVTIRSIGIGLGSLGVLLIISSGLGLLTWLLTRPRVPGWYRAMIIIASLLMTPIAFTVLFGFGVLDHALHPRRRAARSAKVDDRGSGRS